MGAARCSVYLIYRIAVTNLVEFMSGLMYDLSNANGFKVVSHYFGPTPLLGSEILEYFEKTIAKIGEHEQFTYS